MSYDNGEVRATYIMEEALDKNRRARAQLTALSICHRRRLDRDHETRQERKKQHHGTEKTQAQMDRIERMLKQLENLNAERRRGSRSTSRSQKSKPRSNPRNSEHQPRATTIRRTRLERRNAELHALGTTENPSSRP
jgi:hypothetical protein